MGVVERLTLEAVSGHTLLACEHVHRYHFAAPLCEGANVLDLCCGSGYGSRILRDVATSVVGVDTDVATVDAAAATIGRETDIAFEVADAVEYLDRQPASRFDVIVCFEGLEHLDDLDAALRAIKRFSNAGAKLVLSVPNSRTLDEENEFHRTDFSYELARTSLESLGPVTMYCQHHAQGSLIRGDEEAELRPQAVLDEHREREWANTFLALVNFERTELSPAPSAWMSFAIAPEHNRFLHNLERSNRELWYANARLARRELGRFDTAAVTAMEREARATESIEAHRAAEARATESIEAHRAAEARAHEAERREQELHHRLAEVQRSEGALREQLLFELRRPSSRARRVAARALGLSKVTRSELQSPPDR